MKTKLIITFSFAAINLLSAETYTVKTPLWETTNAVKVVRNHEPGCTLIVYVERGSTNDFHAWNTTAVVTTNKINKTK